MVVVNHDEGFRANDTKGVFGNPWGVGEYWLGWSFLGEETPLAGIYTMRRTRGGRCPIKCRFYAPVVPGVGNQLDMRFLFADAVAAWQGLTTEQKSVYNRMSYPRHMSGYNRFISLFLRGLVD